MQQNIARVIDMVNKFAATAATCKIHGIKEVAQMMQAADISKLKCTKRFSII
jgi:hypothetical protein